MVILTQHKWFWTVLASVILTLSSYAVAGGLGWITGLPSYLELSAVFTSYVCTILCVHQTRWNYPIGVLTTFLYSWLFYQWEMYAVSLFNLYLVFSLAYGWFRWGPDGNTRPVTLVQNRMWFGYFVLGIVIYLFLDGVNRAFGVTITGTEIAITVLSGVAQFLLDNKKIETWAFWFVVNVLSIWFFFTGGLYLVAFQYVFFLANTLYGAREWTRSMAPEDWHIWDYKTK